MRRLRPPAQPAARPMALMLACLALLSSVAQAGWTAPAHAPAVPPFVAWTLLNGLAYFLPMAGLPVVRALGLTRPDDAEPGRRWAAFTGVFVAMLLVGSVARAVLATAWIGVPMDALALLGPTPGIALILASLEFHAAFERACRTEHAAVDATLADVLASRAALLRVHDRTVEAVLARLGDRISPELGAVQADMAALARAAAGGDAPDEATIAALIDRLRAVNEEELRPLSHRLHPSVIKLGLTPALRALAAAHEPHLFVDVHPSRGFLEADRLVDGAFSPDERLAAYRIAEAALAELALQAEPGEAVLTIGLEGPRTLALGLVGATVGESPTRGEAALARQLLDSRVRVAGGAWSLTPGLEGGTVLRATVPLGAAAPADAVGPSAAPSLGPFEQLGPAGSQRKR